MENLISAATTWVAQYPDVTAMAVFAVIVVLIGRFMWPSVCDALGTAMADLFPVEAQDRSDFDRY